MQTFVYVAVLNLFFYILVMNNFTTVLLSLQRQLCLSKREMDLNLPQDCSAHSSMWSYSLLYSLEHCLVLMTKCFQLLRTEWDVNRWRFR